MKFLCDRCKTRYTIADERVRGKVLKIRCKNCANVISVREGQPDPDAPSATDDAVPRSDGSQAGSRPTAASTGRTVAASGRPNKETSPPSDADDVGAKVAKAPPRPPTAAPVAEQEAAHDDEWYVSIDGNQSGPFTLTEAQAWVRGRPLADELHCWCEGFGDWLPVEKVRHFRGLRAPRGSNRPATLPPPVPADSKPLVEPKPLFAATMAQLEADASSSEAATSSAGKKRAGTPPPVAPSGNGKPASAPGLSLDELAKGEQGEKRGKGTKTSPGDLFDGGGDYDHSEATPPPTDAGMLARRGEPAPADAAIGGDDDDLSIGEVSRVVRIADLAKGGRTPTAAAATVRRTSAAPAAVVRATGTGPVLKPGVAYVGAPAAPEGEVHAAPAERSHGIYYLAGILLLGLIGAIVVVVVSQSKDDGTYSGVNNDEYDNNLGRKIDDPQHRGQTGSGSGSSAVAAVKHPTATAGSNTGSGHHDPTGSGSAEITPPQLGPDGQPLTSLDGTDVENMSRTMSAGSTRCWENAQKKDPFIQAKAIKVTLVVNTAGIVTDASVSDFATEFLGQCLVAAVKRWKFRPSTEGITSVTTFQFTKN